MVVCTVHPTSIGLGRVVMITINENNSHSCYNIIICSSSNSSKSSSNIANEAALSVKKPLSLENRD